MAVAVVDLLETVEVDHQQGYGGGLGSSEQVSAALLQMASVGQVGQRVGAGFPAGLGQRAELVEGERRAQQGGDDAGSGELARGQREGELAAGHQYREGGETGHGRRRGRRAFDRLGGQGVVASGRAAEAGRDGEGNEGQGQPRSTGSPSW